MEPNTGIESPPRMLLPSNKPYVSFTHLLDLVIRKTYHDLYVACDLLSQDSDVKRKLFLVEFSQRTRLLFIRLLALLRFCTSSNKISQCLEMRDFLFIQNQYFCHTANTLAELSRTKVPQFRIPSFFIPAAVDVLTKGTYTRLPTCIKDLFSTEPKLTDEEVTSTGLITDSFIRTRLMQSSIPREMEDFTIEKGRVTFFVEGKFKISLTLFFEDSSWRITSLQFHGIDEESRFHSHQVAYLTDALQSRLVDCERPLEEIFSFTNCLWNSVKLELMFKEVLRLREEGLGEHMTVEKYSYGTELVVGYWKTGTENSSSATTMYLIITMDSHSIKYKNFPPLMYTEGIHVVDPRLSFDGLWRGVIRTRTVELLENLRNQLNGVFPDLTAEMTNKREKTVLLVKIHSHVTQCCASLSVSVDLLTGRFSVGGIVDPFLLELVTCSINGSKFDSLDTIIIKIKCWLLRESFSSFLEKVGTRFGCDLSVSSTQLMEVLTAQMGTVGKSKANYPVVMFPLLFSDSTLGDHHSLARAFIIQFTTHGSMDLEEWWIVSYSTSHDGDIILLSEREIGSIRRTYTAYYQICLEYLMCRLFEELIGVPTLCAQMTTPQSISVYVIPELPGFEANISFLLRNGGTWLIEFKSSEETIMVTNLAEKTDTHVAITVRFMEIVECISQMKSLINQKSLSSDSEKTIKIKDVNYASGTISLTCTVDGAEFTYYVVWNRRNSAFSIIYLSDRVCDDVNSVFDQRDVTFKVGELNWVSHILSLSASCSTLIRLKRLLNYSDFVGGMINQRKHPELVNYFKIERISTTWYRLEFRSLFSIELYICDRHMVIRQGGKTGIPHWRTFISKFEAAYKNYHGNFSLYGQIASVPPPIQHSLSSPANILTQSVPSIASTSPSRVTCLGHLLSIPSEPTHSVSQYLSPLFGDLTCSPNVKMKPHVSDTENMYNSEISIQLDKLQQLPYSVTRDQLDLLLSEKCWLSPHDVVGGTTEWECPLLFHFFVCVVYRHWILNYSREEMKQFNMTRHSEEGPNSMEVICFKSEYFVLKICFGLAVFPFLSFRVLPSPESPENWTVEELRSLENFFMSRVLCYPYSHQLLVSYFRIFGASRGMMRDLVTLIHEEKSLGQGPWEFRMLLVFPYTPNHAGYLVHSSAVFIRPKSFFLFQLRMVGGSGKSVTIPICYDIEQNCVSISEHSSLPNCAYLKQYLPQRNEVVGPFAKCLLYDYVALIVRNFCRDNT